jgi:hypothetical protein
MKARNMKRSAKITTATIIGLVIPLLAAFAGSVGPEPSGNVVGHLVSLVYQPYFMIFCGPFGWAGFVMAIALHGCVFGAVVWLATGSKKI